MSTKDIQFNCYCTICKKRQFFLVPNPKIKTTRLCVLILRSLHCLKTDIYTFITDHWELLGKLKLFQSPNWKKAILDAFNHCSQIESGKNQCFGRGYYNLKHEENNLAEKIEIKTELYQQYEQLQESIQKNITLLCRMQLRRPYLEIFDEKPLFDIVRQQLDQMKHVTRMRSCLCFFDNDEQ